MATFSKCFSAILYGLGMFVSAAESGLLMLPGTIPQQIIAETRWTCSFYEGTSKMLKAKAQGLQSIINLVVKCWNHGEPPA